MSATDSLFSISNSGFPDFTFEEELFQRGKKTVAGIDEAGRGPLAGPVVAAAVVLDPNKIPNGLNDSKKLNAKARENIFEEIINSSHVAWSAISSQGIDHHNIRGATLLAMTTAALSLELRPDATLIDGRDVPLALAETGKALVKGDGRSLSIAAASIVAKVIRDRMMIEADKQYPEYGFAKHKGYGSAAHREAIQRIGPCPLHRRSFEPVKSMLSGNHY